MFEKICRIIELLIISASAVGTFYACRTAVKNSNRNSEEQIAQAMLRSITEALRLVRQVGELNTSLNEMGYGKLQNSPEAIEDQCNAFFRSRPDVVHLLYLLNTFAVFLHNSQYLDEKNYSNIFCNSVDAKTFLWLGYMSEYGNLSPALCQILQQNISKQ